jgi:hypothetical protein
MNYKLEDSKENESPPVLPGDCYGLHVYTQLATLLDAPNYLVVSLVSHKGLPVQAAVDENHKHIFTL